MYFLNEFFDGEQVCNTIIKPVEGGIISIPISSGNPQYEAYLAWLDEGNEVGSWAEHIAHDHDHPTELPPLEDSSGN